MGTVKVSKSSVEGTVQAPPSKSETHRALFIASLASGRSGIHNPLFCDDTLATIGALEKLGVKVVHSHKGLAIEGGGLRESSERIDCRESGTTLRFLMALCALVKGSSVLIGAPSLLRRPNQPLLDGLNRLGVNAVQMKDKILIKSDGLIKGAELTLPSNISSQFVSALLLIAPKTENGIVIHLSAPLESREYAELTTAMQRRFGVTSLMNESATRFECGPQEYRPALVSVEGDWSSSAFLLASGALAGKVSVTGVDVRSVQPDRRVLDAVSKMGAEVEIEKGKVTVKNSGSLSPLDFDVSGSPDLFPVLSVLCSVADGVSHVYGVSRNRLKESDRVKAVREGLLRCGVLTEETENELTIFGGKIKSAEIEAHNDHRIAMAFAVLGLIVDEGIGIKDADSVSKSFPEFFDVFKSLGARLEVVR